MSVAIGNAGTAGEKGPPSLTLERVGEVAYFTDGRAARYGEEIDPSFSSMVFGGTTMKRNWDLVRDIMLEVESLSPGTQTFAQTLEVPGYDRSEVDQHCALLVKEGLLEGRALNTFGGGVHVHISGITWAGHDWLASIRSESIWAETKGLAKSKGVDLTFDLIKTIAVAFVKVHLGLPG